MPFKREVPADKLTALARYNVANGHGDDPKVTMLNLLKQMHTADIVSFPEPAHAAFVIEFPRQATA